MEIGIGKKMKSTPVIKLIEHENREEKKPVKVNRFELSRGHHGYWTKQGSYKNAKANTPNVTINRSAKSPQAQAQAHTQKIEMLDLAMGFWGEKKANAVVGVQNRFLENWEDSAVSAGVCVYSPRRRFKRDGYNLATGHPHHCLCVAIFISWPVWI